LFEPITSTTSCKQYMLQKVIIILLSAEIIYRIPSELIKDIFLKLQKNNIFIINKKYKFIPREY
jgi:hypothetical protein